MERRNVVALLGWFLALAPMAQAQGARAQTARAQARAISSVPSEEPSSTTIAAQSAQSCRASESSAPRSVASALYAATR